MDIKVFTYGSLKRGKSNHSVLKHSDFLGVASTIDAKYTMFHNSAYPAVIETEYCPKHIGGEVFRVNPKTLALLDQIEGNGYYYTRNQVGVLLFGPHGEEVEKAWMYSLMHNGKYVWTSERSIDDIAEENGILYWRK